MSDVGKNMLLSCFAYLGLIEFVSYLKADNKNFKLVGNSYTHSF